jgi:NAD/NADP transhydrogenase beta subunit
MVLQEIFLGAVSGVVANLIGYFKQKEVPQYDGVQLVQTVLIGAVIGGVASFQGIQYTDAEGLLAGMSVLTGLTAVTEQVAKAIWRRFAK